MAAAEGMLDEEHPDLPQSRHDMNQYSLGKIGEHNVVIACLPSGMYGTTSAAVVARDMQSSFPSLRFGLMVGIGGGMPKLPEYDIRLGDVVVGQPTSTNGGVIQYDLGKAVQDGQFTLTGSLNGPPKVLLTAVSKLQAKHLKKNHELLKHVVKMIETYPKMEATYAYCDTQNDQLFEATYNHRGGSATCAQCDKTRLVYRGNGARNTPSIHYGLIASGNQVIKDAQTRDSLREKLSNERDGEILCFEMEAAGLMNTFPCLVIRGICDYADTHKNKDWQDRAAATAAAYAKELLYVILPEQVIDARKVVEVTGNVKTNVMTDVETRPDHERYFLISRERVLDFVGRETELREIQSYFSASQTTQLPCLILHALGGQGKSQIALEYCRRSRETYRGIFWINAHSEVSVSQSYRTIASVLVGGRSTDAGDTGAQTRLVKDRLESWSEPWLLVFDNYDDPKHFPSVKSFIPKGGRGHVLFTSRNQDLGRLGKLFEIPPMTTEEGVRLLLREYDDCDVEQHMAVASSIVVRLGCLALAIDQAAAYIKYKKMPLHRLGEFLTTYEAQRGKVLSYTPQNFWEYETMQIHGGSERNKTISAFTTWEISFEQLDWEDESEKEDIAHFLTLSAFFDPAKIGESMFRDYKAANGRQVKWMHIFGTPDYVEGDEDDAEDDEDYVEDDVDDAEGDEDNAEDNKDDIEDKEEENNEDDVSSGRSAGGWDSDRFWGVIAKSYELSLLQSISNGIGAEGASFSLHPLIRDWLQLREKAEERRKYTREAIEVVASSVIMSETRALTLEQKRVLMAHMDASMSNDTRFSKPQGRFGCEISNCVNASWFVWFYASQGRYDTSKRLINRIAETRRNTIGIEHPLTLSSRHQLARILGYQGQYKQAEEIYREVLQLRETVLGKEHPDTLTSMNNLGLVLNYQGKYEQAEEIHREVLRLQETVLGKEHLNTLTSMNNLGLVLDNQGKHEQAEEIHREVLRLGETVQGKEHPDTLISMNNLGLVLYSQGKYEQAEEIHREVLRLGETVLGKEHPDTLLSMNNLGFVLNYQGKYEQAEEILREVLRLRETVLGKEHPDMLMSMNNLGYALDHQGKHEQAEEILREVLRLRETVLGKEHPNTLQSAYNLAYLLHRQQRFDEADPLYRRTLMGYEKTLGSEHPDAQACREYYLSMTKAMEDSDTEMGGGIALP